MINKICWSFLAKLSQKERGKTQITKMRNDKGDTTTNLTEIKKSRRGYCEQLYASKLDNLDEMDKFLERQKPLELIQEGI